MRLEFGFSVKKTVFLDYWSALDKKLPIRFFSVLDQRNQSFCALSLLGL